jgi:hypothetical protein
MTPLVKEMRRKQPGNEEVRTLETWLNARLGK